MNLTPRRRALLILLTFASLLGLPGMASAATTNEAGWTFFTTNGPCVWTNAAMSDE